MVHSKLSVFSRVKSAAIKTIHQVKQRSMMYMRNNMTKIPKTDMNIDIQPSYLLIPENGILNQHSKLICIDFGHLSLRCKPKDDLNELHAKLSSELADDDNKNLVRSIIIKGSYWKFDISLKDVQIILALNETDWKRIKSNQKQHTANHILKPLDLFLDLYKCAYDDDANLPSMKISSELPMIDICLTDVKLENILRILLSIAEKNSHYANRDRIVDNPIDTLISSYEENELFKENIFGDMMEKINKAPDASNNIQAISKASQVVLSTTPQQTISIEFKFEIKDIFIRINEEKKRYFDSIQLSMSSIGTTVKMMSYDIDANIFLNSIALEYRLLNDVDGSKLYLINSIDKGKKRDDTRLIDIKLVKTDETSPTLEIKHDNVLLNALIEFHSLNVVVHKPAIANMLKFVYVLKQSLSHIQTTVQIKPDKKQNPASYQVQRTNRPNLDENQFNDYLFNQDHKKSGKFADNQRLINLQVNVKIFSLNARLCDLKSNYFFVSVNDLNLKTVCKSFYYEFDFSLRSIGFLDMQPDAYYRQIFNMNENDDFLVNLNLKMFLNNHLNYKFYLKNYLNETNFDMILSGKISKLKLVFLYQHLSILLNFLDAFNTPADSKSMEYTAEIKNTKSQQPQPDDFLGSNVDNYVDNSELKFISKTKLDVTINAPLIIIPQNSKSNSGLQLDCGVIRLTTTLDILRDYFENTKIKIKYKLPPCIEQHHIQLFDLKITRVLLDENLGVNSELVLVDSSEFNLTINRNLQESINIVPLFVEANYDGLMMSLGKSDLKFILTLVQQNLNEKVCEEPDDDVDVELQQSKPAINKTQTLIVYEKAEQIENREKTLQKTTNVAETSVQMRIRFQTQSIKLFLYATESDVETMEKFPKDTRRIVRNLDEAFSKLEFKSLKVEALTYTDKFKLYFMVDTVTLDDLRLKGPNPLNRLIEKRQLYETVSMPMIGLSFESKTVKNGTGIKVDSERLIVNLNSLRLCISVDYAVFLYDFFVGGLSSSNAEVLTDRLVDELAKSVEKSNRISSYTYELRIENPQIILVEDQLDIENTNTFILDAQAICKIVKNDSKTKTNLSLSDFLVKFCGLGEQTDYLFLAPAHVTLDSHSDGKNEKYDLILNEICVNMCPSMLNSLLNIISSIESTFEKLKAKTVGFKPASALNTFGRPISFNDNDFWYTKTRQQYQNPNVKNKSKDEKKYSTQLTIISKILSIKLEADIAEQLPLIGVNINLTGDAKNFDENMIVNLVMGIEVAYFNKSLAIWEPLVELCELENSVKQEPWELFIKIIKNDKDLMTSRNHLESLRSHGSTIIKQILPSYSILFHSEKTLQIVFTRTFLNLIDSTVKLFTEKKKQQIKKPNARDFKSLYYHTDEAIELECINEDESTSSILIKNQLGYDVILTALSGFKFWNDRINRSDSAKFDDSFANISLKNNHYCPIILTESMHSIMRFEDNTKKNLLFSLKTVLDQLSVNVNVSQCGTNGYYVSAKDDLVICETVSQFDKKRVYLRSPVQIRNSLKIDLFLQFEDGDMKFSQIISNTKNCCVPMQTVHTKMFSVKPIFKNKDYKLKTINWNTEKIQLLDFADIFMQVKIEKEPISIATSLDTSNIDYMSTITFIPVVTLINYLPFTIQYKIADMPACVNDYLRLGETAALIHTTYGSVVYFEIKGYLNTNWYASMWIAKCKELEEIGIIQFRSADQQTLSLGLFCTTIDETISYRLYAPYWIVNKTSLKLEYQFPSDSDVHELDETQSESPVLLKCNSKVFLSAKTQILLRVKRTTAWSEPFIIDTVGSTGTAVCKAKNKHYEIAVRIKLSDTGLTKIISLTPYFLLINETDMALQACEMGDNEWLDLKANAILPFWPMQLPQKIKQKRCLQLRTALGSAVSKPFWFNCKHSTTLTLDVTRKSDAIHVDCEPCESVIKTRISRFDYGKAPVLIVNRLNKLSVVITEDDDDQTTTCESFKLFPRSLILYVWHNPIGSRRLRWSCGCIDNEPLNLDTIESKSNYLISDTDVIHCLVFLDGLQKVIMFVDDLYELNDEVTSAGGIDGIEYSFGLHSLGLSLVDNFNHVEIAYLYVSSDSIVWGEMEENERFRKFKNDRIVQIEDAYSKYNEIRKRNSSASFLIDKNDNFEVNFEDMTYYSTDKKGFLKRQLAPSISIDYCNSSKQTTLHLIIEKLQIDNQLENSIYSVAFAKILPKTLVTFNKPLIELSMVQTNHVKTGISEMKYFKILIQEFFIKVDQRILSSLITFFGNDELTKSNRDSIILQEELMCEVQRTLKEIITANDENNHKDLIYFHMCHVSPIKIHLSYSMMDYGSSNEKLLLKNPYLQSIASTLTDMQDVVFKLDYFEVKNCAHSLNILADIAFSHYKHEIIRQGYVLMLGLDVIGNPYSLYRGISEGVESFFYEPYAGIIKGPTEFLEGVGVGIISLLGQTVGSAAGAFSKITGTLGKSLATLSMDKDYQKARNRQSDAQSASMKNIGQNLFKGVLGGFTGVVMKPLDGVKQEGLEGFVKGVGKGLLGIVTKPAGSIVDFTSQSFEGIRKVAVQEESIKPIRPARVIYEDGVVKTYRLHEAQGARVLKSVQKGKYAKDKFVAKLDIYKDFKYQLICTNNRILFVKKGLFNDLELEWSYEFTELKQAPTLSAHGIQFFTKNEEKHVFSHTTYGKIIPINDLQLAKEFVSKASEEMEKSN